MAQMAEVIGIDHIYIAVSDLQRSEQFYDRVLLRILGFRKGKFRLNGDPHIQYFNRYFGYVLRPAHTAGRHVASMPGMHHLCFRVDSIAEVRQVSEALNEAGIESSEAKCFPEYAADYWATFFTDPDGLQLEVTNFRQERRDRQENWERLFPPVLILPGIGNSGPMHWQTLWEQDNPDFVRIRQHDWDNPVCADWVGALEAEITRLGPDPVLVAHSLACLMVAHWAARSRTPIAGALLVAVPDPNHPNFPVQAKGFSNPPQKPFSFPSIVVVSDDDPFASHDYAEHLAGMWGSRSIHIGKQGHINAESGLGDWLEGFELLNELRRG